MKLTTDDVPALELLHQQTLGMFHVSIQISHASHSYQIPLSSEHSNTRNLLLVTYTLLLFLHFNLIWSFLIFGYVVLRKQLFICGNVIPTLNGSANYMNVSGVTTTSPLCHCSSTVSATSDLIIYCRVAQCDMLQNVHMYCVFGHI